MKDIEDSLWFCFPPRGPQAQIALVVRIQGGGGWQAGGSLRRVTSWQAGCGAPQTQDGTLGTMNPVISITLLLSVLQMSRGQRVISLTACLVNQNLRLDCRHENNTNLPIQHEFSLTREKKKHVLSGTLGVPEHTYRSRVTFFSDRFIKVLTLANFTNKDEGDYMCELRVSGQNPTSSNKTVNVIRDKLVKCGGISLLVQNTSWLLLLLLSLSFLQATDFISL